MHSAVADPNGPVGGRDGLRRCVVRAASRRGVADCGADRRSRCCRGRQGRGRPGRGVRGRAAREAAQALTDLADSDGAPAATYVSAIVTQRARSRCAGSATAAPTGSREPPTRRAQRHHDITGGSGGDRDDSLAEEIVAAGLATMDEAMASPQAHVITRWLGADLPDPEPHVEQFSPPGPGVLLLCSDGLWNYRPEAARPGRHGDARRADPAADAAARTWRSSPWTRAASTTSPWSSSRFLRRRVAARQPQSGY